jgi:hypothetical protein
MPIAYNQLQQFAEKLFETGETKATSGEYYDLPDKIVYNTATKKLPPKGRLEANRITPEAKDHFEWLYEITLDDRESGLYRHILLMPDEKLVETYGKKVIPVDEETGQQLAEIANKLLSS